MTDWLLIVVCVCVGVSTDYGAQAGPSDAQDRQTGRQKSLIL